METMGARKWIFGGLVIVAIAIVAFTVNALRVQDEHEQSKLEAALARAESLGLPVYAEHLRNDQIPDEENAWVEIDAIREMTNGRDSQGGDWVNSRDFIDVEDPFERTLLFRRMVDDWQPALALAKIAANKPGFDAHREWEAGVAMFTPDLYLSQAVCRVLVQEAKIRFDDGDLPASLKSLRAAKSVASFYFSERVWLHSIPFFGVHRRIGEEIVRQSQLGVPERHQSALRELLVQVFETTGPKEMFAAETVTFVETIRMVNEENEIGQREFKEYREFGFGVDDEEFGTFLPPAQAVESEVMSINAACDYYESLSSDLADYKSNDEQYANMVNAPYDWVSVYGAATDGFEHGVPFGFLAMYDDWLTPYSVSPSGPFSGRAWNLLRGEAYLAAFDHVTGVTELQDSVTWNANVIPVAELVFELYEGGFSITATAPDLEPLKLKFDRP